MSQYYVGVKIIFAWEETRDGKEGYAVKYPDGYISWSPKDVFESAYLPMGDGNDNRVTQEMVEKFLGKRHIAITADEKTTLVKATMVSGFVQYEASSCVDPKYYDLDVGTEICLNRIKDTIWKCLGFIIQWGKFGIKQ